MLCLNVVQHIQAYLVSIAMNSILIVKISEDENHFLLKLKKQSLLISGDHNLLNNITPICSLLQM